MTNSCTKNNLRLIPFLHELADLIEKDELSPELLKCVGDFYMSYKFHDQRHGNENNDEDEDFNAVKFITLGWYIYNVILAEEKIDSIQKTDSVQDSDLL